MNFHIYNTDSDHPIIALVKYLLCWVVSMSFFLALMMLFEGGLKTLAAIGILIAVIAIVESREESFHMTLQRQKNERK